MAFCWPMAPLSRSPARIASVRIPSESLGGLAQPSVPGGPPRRCGTWQPRVTDPVEVGCGSAGLTDARPVTPGQTPGKPKTARWSASARRDRESRPSSGPIMSQGCTSAGTTSYGRGQRGCPPDAVLDRTSSLSPRTAGYQPAQGVLQARQQLPSAAPALPGVPRTAHAPEDIARTARSDRGPALGTSTDASAPQREGRCVGDLFQG
jgi:hypothetical protein